MRQYRISVGRLVTRALAISIVAALSTSACAQNGYGIRGAGGLRANSIMGSGGLRGNSIVGSGGLGANNYGTGLGMYRSSFQGMRSGVNTGKAAGSQRKPFSSYNSQPTVSPYLNLFRNDLGTGGTNLNYSTLVEPQLRQQQVNQQLQRQDVQANRRLQSIAAQSDYNPEGAKDQYPTGHQTAFNYMGHYYPAVQPNQKRRTQ